MDGPPASSATTSFVKADGPSLEQRAGSAPPSPVPLVDRENGEHRHLYTQPDYAVKTKDTRLPELETRHAGLTALRRVFVGPSFYDKHGGPGGPFAAHGGCGGGGKGKEREPDPGDRAETGLQQSTPFPTRRRRRASTSATNRTGQTVGSSTHGDSARGGWHGASFEIGGDIRDAARRRNARLARQREEEEARVRREREEAEQRNTLERELATPVTQAVPRSPALTTGASFATAYTHVPPSTQPDHAPASARPRRTSSLAHVFHRRPSNPPHIVVTDGTASDGLVEAPKHRPEVPRLQSILRPTDAAPSADTRFPHSTPTSVYGDAVSHQQPGVRFPEEPASVQPLAAGSGAAPPAPPSEVLARPDPDVEPEPPSAASRLVEGLRHPLGHGTSAQQRPPQRRKRPGDAVLRKERMLVRVDWTQREDLPDHFDEHVARKYPTSKDAWEEVAVVWRASGQIELWGEFVCLVPSLSPFVRACADGPLCIAQSLNLPATLLHRKKLKTVIPLTPKKTHFSVYSSTDLIFCLTHRPHSHTTSTPRTAARGGKPDERTVDGPDKTDEQRTHKASKRGRLHFRTEGTNIFLFRARTHTIAKEWTWRLYRTLGGQLPRTLEVNVPSLGAVVRLPVPHGLGDGNDDEDELETGDEDERAYRLLQPQGVVDACVAQLAHVPEWHDLVETTKRDGTDLQLAWRRDSVLDWVGKDRKGQKKRDWAVIGGIAFRQVRPLTLCSLAAERTRTDTGCDRHT